MKGCEGQINIFDLTMPLFKIDKPIRLIELFAGVGSQTMSLRDLGADFEHYRVVEFDKYAIASYNAIHGTVFSTMDITKVSGADLAVIDTDKYCYIMTYSFPCQDLSVAGKMKGMTKGSGTRSGLLWEVERLLNEVENLPQVLLMENVPQIHSKDNMPDFQKWIDFLTSKGYSNYWQDLNAKDYGVAQNRERCFMVSILGEYNYRFPQPLPLTKTMKDYLEDEVDEKYYINNEKAQKLIRSLLDSGVVESKEDYEMDGNFNQRGKVHGEEAICRTLLGCGHAGNEPKVLKCVDLSINNPEEKNVYDFYNQTLKDGGVCGTITGACSHNGSGTFGVIEPQYRIRKLTPLECWLLMSFSIKDFLAAKLGNREAAKSILAKYPHCGKRMFTEVQRIEKMSNTQLYKQAGNSIVKIVLMAIFGQMLPGKEDVYKQRES